MTRRDVEVSTSQARTESLVEIAWKVFAPDRVLTIGASGGGSRTKTREDAITQNAYVKVRPTRVGWVRVVDPFR